MNNPLPKPTLKFDSGPLVSSKNTECISTEVSQAQLGSFNAVWAAVAVTQYFAAGPQAGLQFSFSAHNKTLQLRDVLGYPGAS